MDLTADRQVSMPGAFKLDQLQPVESLLLTKFSNFFTFIMGVQFLLPQRAKNKKRELTQLQKWTWHTPGIQTGPIAACWAPFAHQIFQIFHFHHGSLITPEGRLWEKNIHPTPEMDLTKMFQYLGHFNWTNFSLLSPFCSPNFPTFFTFIMGVQFLLPQRANYEKREFTQLQKGTRHRGFSAWGIQTGLIAACWAPFVHQIFQLFHFHHGSPILITPEG